MDVDTVLAAVLRPLLPLAQGAPPRQTGTLHSADLVDLAALGSTITLDIRDATPRNLAGRADHVEPRASLQRPVTDRLARAKARGTDGP